MQTMSGSMKWSGSEILTLSTTSAWPVSQLARAFRQPVSLSKERAQLRGTASGISSNSLSANPIRWRRFQRPPRIGIALGSTGLRGSARTRA
jgi:hypothetical protein